MYTKDQNCLGLVLKWYKHGDLRKLLDQTATNLTIEKRLLLLMDIAEVTKHDVSFLPFGASIVTS